MGAIFSMRVLLSWAADDDDDDNDNDYDDGGGGGGDSGGGSGGGSGGMAAEGASCAQTLDGGGLHEGRELRRPVHAAPQGRHRQGR